MKKLAIALALSPLLAGCGGPLLFAQVEVPKVQITLPSQTIPATDSSAQYWCSPTQTQPTCVATSLSYDLGAQLPVVTQQNASYAIRLTTLSMSLAATSAGTTLAGVKAVSVRVIDPAAGGDGAVIASYARSAADPSPTAISVAGDSNLDLAPYVRSGQLDVRLEMTYDAPTPEFTADVTSTWSFEAKLDWGAYL